MKLENLMIEAIKKFKKEHKNAEIRTIYVAEGTGDYKNWSEAAFCIDYVEMSCGQYHETYVRVSADK